MGIVESIEKPLEDVFKNAPSLDKKTKETIVNIWPWVALVAGILQVYAAWALWHAGHLANQAINAVNSFASAYGVNSVAPELGLLYYIGLIFLAASGIVALMAYPALKRREKSGWDLLFLGVLLDLVYGVVMLFVSYYGGASRLLGAVIGAAIGFYFLFQIREFYVSHKTAKVHTT